MYFTGMCFFKCMCMCMSGSTWIYVCDTDPKRITPDSITLHTLSTQFRKISPAVSPTHVLPQPVSSGGFSWPHGKQDLLLIIQQHGQQEAQPEVLLLTAATYGNSGNSSCCLQVWFWSLGGLIECMRVSQRGGEVTLNQFKLQHWV